MIDSRKPKAKYGNLGIVLFLMLLTASCTTTRVASLLPPEGEEIELYTTNLPDRSFTEVCHIEVIGSAFVTPERLMRKLKKKAQALGADAVVQIRYDYIGLGPVIYGTAVVYQ